MKKMEKNHDTHNTQDSILKAAKELFSTKGYKATSVRDIAQLASVNSALIRYYFQSKQGLLVAIASELFQGDFDEILSILDEEALSLDDLRVRLSLFLDFMMLRGLEKWSSLTIVKSEVYELSKIESFNFGPLSYQSITKLASFLKMAKKKSLIKKDVDCLIVADNLMSLAVDLVLNWKINIKNLDFDISKKENRKHWISQTIKAYLFGVTS